MVCVWAGDNSNGMREEQIKNRYAKKKYVGDKNIVAYTNGKLINAECAFN